MRSIKTIGVMIFLAVLVLGYFYYVSNKDQSAAETSAEATAVQEIILKDLSVRYPPTPKEVVTLYAEITRVLHNEAYTDEEMSAMAEQLRKLFDADLLAVNPLDQYLASLKAEIQVMKDKTYRISSFIVSDSTDVDFYTHNNYECARLHCFFYISSGSQVAPPSDNFFVLRKDADGHWKIMGWEYVNENAGEADAAEAS